jgi:multiple sugar transport system permease protein
VVSGSFIDRYARWIFPLPALLFVAIMMVFPILYTVRNSLTGWSLGTGTPPTFIGLRNYVALFGDQRFLAAIARTFYFTAIAVAAEGVLGVGIALLLNRTFRGKNLVSAIFLLPMMATPVAIAMVWLLIFEPTVGVANAILHKVSLPGVLWIAGPGSVIPSLALVDIWEWTPMIALITMAGLAGLPGDPFEAARVDGASSWQVLWHVTLPLLRPTITVAVLLRMIDALKTFDIIYTMTGGGPGFSSETLNIYAYQQAFSYYNFGYASSVLVIFFAIVLGMSLLVSYMRNAWEA